MLLDQNSVSHHYFFFAISVMGSYETRARAMVNSAKSKVDGNKTRKRQFRAQKTSKLITNYFATENLSANLNEEDLVQENLAENDYTAIGKK